MPKNKKFFFKIGHKYKVKDEWGWTYDPVEVALCPYHEPYMGGVYEVKAVDMKNSESERVSFKDFDSEKFWWYYYGRFEEVEWRDEDVSK